MKVFCPRCGQPIDVPQDGTTGVTLCKACGTELVFTTESGVHKARMSHQEPATDGKPRSSGNPTAAVAAMLFLLFLLVLLIRPDLVPGSDSRTGQTARNMVFGKKTVDAVARHLSGAPQRSNGERSGESGSARQGRAAGARGAAASGNEAVDSAEGRDDEGQRTESADNRAESSRNEISGRGGRERFQGDLPPANPNPPESQPPGSASDDQNVPARSVGRIPVFGESNAPHAGIRAGVAGLAHTNSPFGNTSEPVPEQQSGIPALDGESEGEGSNQAATVPSAPQTNRTVRSSRSPTNVVTLLDDFTGRLRQAGARSGDVQISLMWNNVNDLDLHCVDPRGEEIYYNHRGSASGGLLDIDMNASPPLRPRPVENIYWPERGAPPGTYVVYVNHYRNHGSRDPTPFTVRVWVKGQSRYYSGTITFGQPKQKVCTFVVPTQ